MNGRMVIAAGLSLMLSGCMAFESKAVRTSQPYRAGYSAGCAAGGAGSATVQTDDTGMAASYRGDRRYRAGYSAGFSACRSSSRGMPNPERGPIADPYPGLPR